jgi:hypothetical protein
MPTIDQEGASDGFSAIRSIFDLELSIDHRSGMEMLNRQITLKERRWSTPTLTTLVKRSLNHVGIPEGRSPKVTNSRQLSDQRKSWEILG